MKVVGLITEYNPFHNGHQYHIEKAKELSQADAVVVVMSGNFVQRGTPAVMPKHLRAKAALSAGASLIIELPACYATGSAEQFAYGAVSLLNKLGCVDVLCFGSESGDIALLKELSDILVKEPQSYKDALQRNLRSGLSFPTARQSAIEEIYPKCEFSQLLEQPNNILGIEYLKSLQRLNSSMEAFTIQRIFSNYHDNEFSENYSSATAIRNKIADKQLSDIYKQIPDSSISLFEENYEKRFPITSDDFSLLLKYRLLNETKISLTEYADVSEELANRIYNRRNQYTNFEQFCELLKTKEITYSRVSRALLHIMLNIKKSAYQEIEYARVLGFRKDAASLLTTIKRNTSIPILTKLTASNDLSAGAKEMLNLDISVSDLYESVITDKYKTPFINEYEHPIVRI